MSYVSRDIHTRQCCCTVFCYFPLFLSFCGEQWIVWCLAEGARLWAGHRWILFFRSSLQRDRDADVDGPRISVGSWTPAEHVRTAGPLRLLVAPAILPLRRLRPAVRRDGAAPGRAVPPPLRPRPSPLRTRADAVRLPVAGWPPLFAISAAERTRPHVHGGSRRRWDRPHHLVRRRTPADTTTWWW